MFSDGTFGDGTFLEWDVSRTGPFVCAPNSSLRETVSNPTLHRGNADLRVTGQDQLHAGCGSTEYNSEQGKSYSALIATVQSPSSH